MLKKMKPKYPEHIISNPNYKLRFDIRTLLSKYPSLLGIRMIPGIIEDYTVESDKGDKVLTELVFQNSMANLSMNLAGGMFNTDKNSDLRFLPISEEAKKIWNGEQVPEDLYLNENNYSFTAICFGLGFLIRNIHCRTFPFYRHFESEQERNEYAEKANFVLSDEEKAYDAHIVEAFKDKKTNVLTHPRIKINHSPTMLNYWHVTLDTYRPTEIEYVSSTEKLNSADKKMFKALKQDLLQNYLINPRPYYRIREADYKIH